MDTLLNSRVEFPVARSFAPWMGGELALLPWMGGEPGGAWSPWIGGDTASARTCARIVQPACQYMIGFLSLRTPACPCPKRSL